MNLPDLYMRQSGVDPMASWMNLGTFDGRWHDSPTYVFELEAAQMRDRTSSKWVDLVLGIITNNIES